MTPIPQDVLRELRRGKGTLFKKWDRALGGPMAGISESADNLFRRGMSMVGIVGGARMRMAAITATVAPHTKRRMNMLKRRPLEADLLEIIGKKTKPIWHVVALEKPPDPLLAPTDELKVSKKLSEYGYDGVPPYPPTRVLKKKDLPLSRTHSQEMIYAINYLHMTDVKPSRPIYREQMDMLASSAAGYDTVDEYKVYLQTLKPHWFKDLVQDVVKIGIVTSVEVIEALENLGQFYEMTSESVSLAKPKMCYLVMSLPIWDICRMSMQMAVNFILYEILKLPKTQVYLEDWLALRKLPYVVQEAVHSEEFELVQPPKRTDTVGQLTPRSKANTSFGSQH